MYSDTCAALRNDVTLGEGENHQFILTFETARDLSAATCTITVHHTNSDDDVLFTTHSSIVSKQVVFNLSPALSRNLGPGTHYYDIWMMDGADFEKPIVYGTITVLAMTTREQP